VRPEEQKPELYPLLYFHGRHRHQKWTLHGAARIPGPLSYWFTVGMKQILRDTASAVRRQSGRGPYCTVSPASASPYFCLPAVLVNAPQGRPDPCMSTPNPYSHPNFFPTHAIIRQQVPPPFALTTDRCFGWGTIVVVATLPLLPLVGPSVRRHRHGNNIAGNASSWRTLLSLVCLTCLALRSHPFVAIC